MEKDKKKHLVVITAALNGETATAIAEKLSLSKERICQILRLYNIDTRKIRRENKKAEIKKIAQNAKKLLNDGLSVEDVRTKLNPSSYLITQLINFGVDLRLVKSEEIEKRNKKCLALYKKGLTAYEIIDILDGVETPNQVYHNVCKVNNSKLPKRVNTRKKKSIKLDKEIAKLKKKHSFTEVTNILNENGVTNLNNGKIKVGLVVQRFYKNQQKKS